VDRAVVIAAFRSRDEATEASEVLQREGIAADAGPRDESIERMCADALGMKFDVVVDAADAERGIALLRRIWPDDAQPEAVQRCPACGASDVASLPRLRIFLVAALVLISGIAVFGERELFLLLIGIVGGLLLLTPRWRCRACGERWR
jgi:hypothetical protein